VLYRPFNYNPPALLIGILITIAHRASWMNASKHRADVKQTLSNQRANIEQKSSRRRAISTFILNTFARCLLDSVNRVLLSYSVSFASQTSDQKRFTVSEVTADWHELITPQRTMRPSIVHVIEQLDQRFAASIHTTAPISHIDKKLQSCDIHCKFPTEFGQSPANFQHRRLWVLNILIPLLHF